MLKFNIVTAKISRTINQHRVIITHKKSKKIYNLIPANYDSVKFYKFDCYYDENHMYASIILEIVSQFMNSDEIIGYEWQSDDILIVAVNNSDFNIKIE